MSASQGRYDALYTAIAKLDFVDEGTVFRLGKYDLALAQALFRLLETPAAPDRPIGTVIKVPRGRQDLSILFGILSQLARLYAKFRQPELGPPFWGSVVVIGMDTALQKRLSNVFVRGIDLVESLRVHRIRRDGWIADAGGRASRFSANQGEVLYLNTRVGWPVLAQERDGFVILDDTSFSTNIPRERALRWAKEHGASRYVVLTNRGNWSVEEALQEYTGEPITVVLPDHEPTGPSVDRRCRDVPVLLSTNRLLRRPPLQIDLVPVRSAPVEQLFADAAIRLREAWKIAAPAPFSVGAAGHLVALLRQALGTIERFDWAAAQDHRARTVTSLVRDLDVAVGFNGPWRNFEKTHWAALRHAARRLAEEIREDNPKHWATILAVDHLRRKSPNQDLIIRTVNSAAAYALEDDLNSYGGHLLASCNLRVIPRSNRRAWTETETTEVLPALPARSRLDVLWSAEATRRVVIAYGWESEWVKKLVRMEAMRIEGTVNRASRLLGVNLPVTHVPEPCVLLEAPDTRVGVDVVDHDPFAIDLKSLSMPVAAFGLRGASKSKARTSGQQIGLPVYLHGNSLVWWVDPDQQVETMLGVRYARVFASDLQRGDQVIVPTGTGREDLFTRLVAAKHRDHDVLDLTAVLGRWWRACRTLLARFDGDESRASRALAEAGCSVTTQLRAWSDGTTIAPQDELDIRRVAGLVGDHWLESNWKRISLIATELRGLHIRIGKRISGAISEAPEGNGPNLRELANALGTDPAEILEEFDVLSVTSVGQRAAIPTMLLGAVQPTGSCQ